MAVSAHRFRVLAGVATCVAVFALALTPSPRADARVDARASTVRGWVDWFGIHPEQRATVGAPVTALWSNSKHLDLFVVGDDGTVRTSWWEADPGWQKWGTIHPEFKTKRGAQVSAVWSAMARPAGGAPPPVTTPPPSTTTTVTSTTVTTTTVTTTTLPVTTTTRDLPRSLDRSPRPNSRSINRHLDLFAVGLDGAVWTTWWEASRGWQKWSPVRNEFRTKPGAPVTAVWSNGTHLDLFVAGLDGAVWTTYWEQGRGWQPWFPIHNEFRTAAGGQVSAAWSTAGHLDLFVAGADGAVWTTSWEQGRDWQRWFPIRNAFGTAPGAPVTALVSNPTHIDLFATRSAPVAGRSTTLSTTASSNGSVWSTYSYAGDDPSWGLLANPGFDHEAMNGVYFFAGNTGGQGLYTRVPIDERNLNWGVPTPTPTRPGRAAATRARSDRDFAVDSMVQAGANVAVMSSWGPKASNRWKYFAPMMTSPLARSELFQAAAGKRLLVMPAIEGGADTTCLGGPPGPNSAAYFFAADFPGTAANPAPLLVAQVDELIREFIVSPTDARTRNTWAMMYDRFGQKRYAINILGVGSTQLRPGADAAFAAGFDNVANRVFRDTGIRVGFTLDVRAKPDPNSTALDPAPIVTNVAPEKKVDGVCLPDPTYNVPQPNIGSYVPVASTAGPYLRRSASVLAVQGFIPEFVKPIRSTSDAQFIQFKQNYLQSWLDAGLPVMLDLSPGYDAEVVFKDGYAGCDTWRYGCTRGYTKAWRDGLSALWTARMKGVVYDSWNGYAEGMTAVPDKTCRPGCQILEDPAALGNTNLNWLRSVFAAH